MAGRAVARVLRSTTLLEATTVTVLVAGLESAVFVMLPLFRLRPHAPPRSEGPAL